MNRDDIIQMARDAGFVDYELDDGTDEAFDIRYVRFAILVATAENKACAKVCDDLWEDDYTAFACAEAIRARGQA
jgi:hypothetical protein